MIVFFDKNRRLVLTPENEADRRTIGSIVRRTTFANPAFVTARREGLSMKGLEPELEFWRQDEKSFVFPRGVLSEAELAAMLETRQYPKLEAWAGRSLGVVPTKFKPRDGQDEAITQTVLRVRAGYPWGGILEAPCGTGKTVMGIEMIARLQVPAVVLVHKTFLMEQWAERLAQFAPGLRVGFVRQDSAQFGEEYDVSIAMIQSVLSRDYGEDFYSAFGLMMADETHRLAAPDWWAVSDRFTAPYRIGLSATPHRKDGLTPVLLATIGPIAHQLVSARAPARLAIVRLKTEVNPRLYVMPWNRKPNLSRMVNALAADGARTARIVNDSKDAIRAGRKVLVLSGRVEHVNTIVGALSMLGFSASKYVGGMKPAEQAKALEHDIVVGTFAMAQEGLDVPEFDTLLLATPQVDIEQAVGRILREHPGKKPPLVVDYVDTEVPVAAGMFKARGRIYARLGIGEAGP